MAGVEGDLVAESSPEEEEEGDELLAAAAAAAAAAALEAKWAKSNLVLSSLVAVGLRDEVVLLGDLDTWEKADFSPCSLAAASWVECNADIAAA